MKVPALKTFPSWLISLAAIGLGFFSFVIAGGIFLNVIGRLRGGVAMMLLAVLVGLAAAYPAFRYSRRFMMAHVSRTSADPAETAPDDDPMASGQWKSRVARNLFLAGVILFPVFIFVLLSSIMNIYA